MSTRATYLLPAAYHSDQQIYFYIHHDGYPAGAAGYFYKMHHCKNTKNGLAGCFFRANDNAEFTTCHEAHSDTEFRYTINHENELSVWKKEIYDEQWNIAYQGAWYHFVNTYLKESEHLHLFKFSENLQRETIMTMREAKRLAKAFTNKVSDRDYACQDVNLIQTQIDEILTQKKRGAAA